MMYINKIEKMNDFLKKFLAKIKFKKNKFLNFTVTAILMYCPIWEITLQNPDIQKDQIVFIGFQFLWILWFTEAMKL